MSNAVPSNLTFEEEQKKTVKVITPENDPVQGKRGLLQTIGFISTQTKADKKLDYGPNVVSFDGKPVPKPLTLQERIQQAQETFQVQATDYGNQAHKLNKLYSQRNEIIMYLGVFIILVTVISMIRL